jgi:hypothetical protein
VFVAFFQWFGVEQLSLPVETISPGIYILRIETNDEIQTLKIVKVD